VGGWVGVSHTYTHVTVCHIHTHTHTHTASDSESKGRGIIRGQEYRRARRWPKFGQTTIYDRRLKRPIKNKV